MRAGEIYPIGAFNANAWVKIYETTLAATTTTITISGLDGDTAGKYLLKVRNVGGGATSSAITIRLNNDSGENYGVQSLLGADTVTQAARATNYTGWSLASPGVTGYICQSEDLMHVKSGYVRTDIQKKVEGINGTTVTRIEVRGYSWNNTTDNVTSIVLAGGEAGAIGIGTHIELWQPQYSV